MVKLKFRKLSDATTSCCGYNKIKVRLYKNMPENPHSIISYHLTKATGAHHYIEFASTLVLDLEMIVTEKNFEWSLRLWLIEQNAN